MLGFQKEQCVQQSYRLSQRGTSGWGVMWCDSTHKSQTPQL